MLELSEVWVNCSFFMRKYKRKLKRPKKMVWDHENSSYPVLELRNTFGTYPSKTLTIKIE